MSGKSLATTKQIPKDLNIETKASVKLDDGATAFLKRELLAYLAERIRKQSLQEAGFLTKERTE
jgi:hypothetical protein